MYDLIVVGAGPAGLTAAIYARRADKSVLVLDKGMFGGQMTFSPKIENYPGYNQISGNELAEKMVSQALEMGAEIDMAEVTGIEKEGTVFCVYSGDDIYMAKTVILATGARHRLLGIDKEEDFIGDGISFCAVCDGAFYANKTVALIGGGNSALQEAILLAETCKKIYVIQNLDYLTGEPRLQEILAKRGNVEVITGTVVAAIADTPEFSAITLEKTADGSRTELPLDGMFVAIGLVPENGTFADLVDLDKAGYVDAGEDCLTRTSGLFVAGDCRRKAVRQVTTATADGAVAAIAACRYIDAM